MIERYLDIGPGQLTDEPENFPTEESPEPRPRDFDRGFFERFFVRRKSSGRIFEVSQDQWQDFSNSKFFVRFSLNWRISGPRNDIFNDEGFPIKNGVEDTNRRSLERAEREYPGILDKLNDNLLEFWDGPSND